MARQIAEAARLFQQQQTGITPSQITVVLSGRTLVITLRGALSVAEKNLARTAHGAAQVREFHRHLFETGADSLRQEIQRITGVAVCDAGGEMESATGAIEQVFLTGTIVQVFLLASAVPAASWIEPPPAPSGPQPASGNPPDGP